METDTATIAIQAAENMERRAENAEGAAAAIAASAAETIDATQRQAAEIVRAAMETELGRRIGALEQEIRECRELVGRHQSLADSLRSELATLTGQVAALATIQMTPDPSSSPLTPPASKEIAEAETTLAEVIPENVSAVVENPVPITEPKRKIRFL